MSVSRMQIFKALIAGLAIFIVPAAAISQTRTIESNIQNIVRRIQSRTETLRSDLRTVSNQGDYGRNQSTGLDRSLDDFRLATDQFGQRLSYHRANTADAQLVLDRATTVDRFFSHGRLSVDANRDWQDISNDLGELARAYNLGWQVTNSPVGSGPNLGREQSNLSNAQLRQLVQRLDTRVTAFARDFNLDLNRNNAAGSWDLRNQLRQLEDGVVDVRNRVNNRQVSSSDVQNLLDHVAFIDRAISDQQFSSQSRTSWNVLRSDFDQLASAFNLSWNGANGPSGPVGNVGFGRGLTGTYRLNSSRSDDARMMAERATRNLPAADRQSVSDSLIRRLNPPDMLAIDQKGNAVTIASSRAPQINFVADGREQVETTPNGRTIRVRATLTGNQLSITRSGDRADDFGVTFERGNYDQPLIVTRTIYSDRLTQPLVVRTTYDKTSDIAQLDLYQGTPGNQGNVGNNGSFVIPSGTQVVAVLDTDLSTNVARENDRFTMTVRSPGQFEGARVEGYVTGVDRSGRISGRAAMTLNFDTIRLRNGSSYRFAGLLESVRTPNGEVVRIDNEGAVRDEDSQTEKTITRTTIGTAVGALIGAIAGGGKGAAIGAIVGAGAGAGSVYVQGKDDLQLPVGTEVTVRVTGRP